MIHAPRARYLSGHRARGRTQEKLSCSRAPLSSLPTPGATAVLEGHRWGGPGRIQVEKGEVPTVEDCVGDLGSRRKGEAQTGVTRRCSKLLRPWTRLCPPPPGFQTCVSKDGRAGLESLRQPLCLPVSIRLLGTDGCGQSVSTHRRPPGCPPGCLSGWEDGEICPSAGQPRRLDTRAGCLNPRLRSKGLSGLQKAQPVYSNSVSLSVNHV